MDTDSEELQSIVSKIRCEDTWSKIQVKEYSKWLKAIKHLSKNTENKAITDNLNQANKILVNIKSIFEWQDGVLINSRKMEASY